MGLTYLLIKVLAVALFINLVPIEVQGEVQLFDHERYIEKRQDSLDNTTDASLVYPNPDPTAYLAGNLANNFLAIKLFRFGGDGTFELEIVHRNFLPLSGYPNLVYIITHIHTKFVYSTSGSIVNIMNAIAANISLIPQYNIRYGANDSATNYDGLISNFVTNPRGVPVMSFTTATLQQLQSGLQTNMAMFPTYQQQSHSGRYIQWYLDYLFASTNQRIYQPASFSSNTNNAQRQGWSYLLSTCSIIFVYLLNKF